MSQEKIIYNTISDKDLFKIYNYYYLHMIHSYINKGYMTYEWLTFPQYKYSLFENSVENCDDLLFHKVSLRENLVNNLLDQGMYFPFLCNKINKIFLGRHRFYGLSQTNQIISQPFLFIKISSLQQFKEKTLSYEIVPPRGMCQKYDLPEEAIKTGLFSISEFLGRQLYESNNYHSEYFIPNPIFQTEKAFHNFITNSWQTYERKYYESESKFLQQLIF